MKVGEKGKKNYPKNIAIQRKTNVASGSHKFSPNEIASALIKLQLIITFLLNQPIALCTRAAVLDADQIWQNIFYF